VFALLDFVGVGGGGEEFGVDDFGEGQSCRQAEVDVAESDFGVGYVLGLEGGVASEGSAGDDVDLVVSEVFLGFDAVAVLVEEVGDHVVEEEDEFVLV
jgi:hypothetical protein